VGAVEMTAGRLFRVWNCEVAQGWSLSGRDSELIRQNWTVQWWQDVVHCPSDLARAVEALSIFFVDL